MDGVVVFDNGLDIAVYIAGDVDADTRARIGVYIGGRPVVFGGCAVLFMAAYEIFTRDLASVCNRGQCVFLFRRAVRMHIGFLKYRGRGDAPLIL